jgi:hypothetical protein
MGITNLAFYKWCISFWCLWALSSSEQALCPTAPPPSKKKIKSVLVAPYFWSTVLGSDSWPNPHCIFYFLISCDRASYNRLKEKKEPTRCSLSRITTTIKYTRDPPHLLKSTTARPVQYDICVLLYHLVIVMMGIKMPEICWVTNINKTTTQLHLVGCFFSFTPHCIVTYSGFQLRFLQTQIRRV